MELTIIGSGTGIPSKTRAYPCTLVKIKDKYLVFDTGPGTLRQLFLAGVTYMDIDHIYYSHFHPDHSLDFVSILFAMRYSEPKRTKPLYVTGPTGLKAFHGPGCRRTADHPGPVGRAAELGRGARCLRVTYDAAHWLHEAQNHA